jgi:hypothetical protein
MAQVSETQLTRPAAPTVEEVIAEGALPPVEQSETVRGGHPFSVRLIAAAARLRFALAVYLGSRLLLCTGNRRSGSSRCTRW